MSCSAASSHGNKGMPSVHGETPGIWYSIDMLLPGIQLGERERHGEISGGLRKYFLVHRLLGYVLLFFVIAGLTGLAEQEGP